MTCQGKKPENKPVRTARKGNEMHQTAPKRQIKDLSELVSSAAELFGDRDYLRYKRSGKDRTLSFAGLSVLVGRIGTAMCDMSCRTVAVIGETSPEWIVTYLAAVNGGRVVVPLDRELAADQIAGFVKRAQVDTVFCSASYEGIFSEEACPDLKHVVVWGRSEEPIETDVEIPADKPLSERLLCWDEVEKRGACLISQGNTEFSSHVIDPDAMCAIIFTSGTTGTSKGVMLNQRALTAAVNASHARTDFDADDVIMSVLPIHHTYEMTCGILTPILIGCTVCINDSLKYVLKNLNYYKPTGLVLVPLFINTIYKKIWDTAAKSGLDKKLRFGLSVSSKLRKIKIDVRKRLFKSVIDGFGGRLKLIVCGGAALNPEMVKNFGDLGIDLCQGYGITECAPLISVAPAGTKKLASVGPPVPGLEVMIDRENPEDETGEIMVRGDNVMMGYYQDEEATAQAIIDGWFATGDYGYIDSDGYIYVTGRKKNVIVLENGKNVFPEEIESYLEKIDLVAECAVVGRLRDDGETVKITAVIFPDQAVCAEKGLSEPADVAAALKAEVARLNKKLPAFKQIRGIELRKTEFDKTTSHKIKRHTIS